MPPTLFIGPSRFGTLEVLAVIRPPADVHIFHVMPLRGRPGSRLATRGNDHDNEKEAQR